MILLIDNYDSFVYNLARYFQRLGQQTHVVRNDDVDSARVRQFAPNAIILSPGPCTPKEAGCSLQLVRDFHETIPILGVCLGHQAIAAALGGCIITAPQPMHGRTSLVQHDGRGLFADLPNPLTACRYHSLAVEEASLPEELEVSARADDGVVMGIRHRSLPVVGVQFHPESILTDDGYQLLASFLGLADLQKNIPTPLPHIDQERSQSRQPSKPSDPASPPHDRPVTF